MGNEISITVPCDESLVQSMADSAMSMTDKSLKTIAVLCSRIVNYAVDTKASYSLVFDTNMGNNVSTYWENHRESR